MTKDEFSARLDLRQKNGLVRVRFACTLCVCPGYCNLVLEDKIHAERIEIDVCACVLHVHLVLPRKNSLYFDMNIFKSPTIPFIADDFNATESLCTITIPFLLGSCIRNHYSIHVNPT